MTRIKSFARNLAANIALSAAVLILSAVSVVAQTADWPRRPVTIVVPYPPGGSIDILARLFAQHLQTALGQSVVIENRAGAAGTIGAGYVAKAPADGYTLLMSASVHVISPYILKATPFDPVDNFVGISEIASGPLLIVANPKVPGSNVAEFLKVARQDPGKFVFATSGYGAAGHLAVEILRKLTSKEADKTLLVTFNGAGPALSQMMVGDIHVMIDPVLSSYPFTQGQKLKALGVTSARRIPLLPDVPTVIELGVPELEFYSWYGMWAPKDTPAPIVRRLHEELAKIVAMPEIRERLIKSGFEPKGSSPDEFAGYLVKEREKYRGIMKDVGIQPR